MIMKKEQMELKEVIKAAILEAFAEMYGVATLNDTDDSAPEDGDGSNTGGNTGNNSGSNTGGNNSGNNSGGNNGSVRPGPLIGPAGLSLR